jgi:hypothetical protein
MPRARTRASKAAHWCWAVAQHVGNGMPAQAAFFRRLAELQEGRVGPQDPPGGVRHDHGVGRLIDEVQHARHIVGRVFGAAGAHQQAALAIGAERRGRHIQRTAAVGGAQAHLGGAAGGARRDQQFVKDGAQGLLDVGAQRLSAPGGARVAEEPASRRVGVQHAAVFVVQHQHGVVAHLEEQPVVGFGIAALPVFAFQFLLGFQKALLDGADGTQIAPHGQQWPFVAQAHGGPGDGDFAAVQRRVVELAAAGHPLRARFVQQRQGLVAVERRNRVRPGATHPVFARRGQGQAAAGHIADHAINADDQRNIARDPHDGRGHLGRQIRQAAGGLGVVWRAVHATR